MVDDSLPSVIQGEHSERILLKSNSPTMVVSNVGDDENQFHTSRNNRGRLLLADVIE